jgi:adenylylsulfate kinase-like enzyme
MSLCYLRKAREIIGPDRFLEIYVSTPLSICEERDVTGHYKKVRTGEILDFTGFGDAIYEPPPSPFLTIDTTHIALDDCVSMVLAAVRAHYGLGDAITTL